MDLRRASEPVGPRMQLVRRRLDLPLGFSRELHILAPDSSTPYKSASCSAWNDVCHAVSLAGRTCVQSLDLRSGHCPLATDTTPSAPSGAAWPGPQRPAHHAGLGRQVIVVHRAFDALPKALLLQHLQFRNTIERHHVRLGRTENRRTPSYLPLPTD
jgi:hypothetical protein